MTSAALTGIAFALYLIAAVCYGAALFLRAPAAPANDDLAPRLVSRVGRPLLLAGLFVQFWAIGDWCLTTRHSPFASEYGTLTVSAWAIALTFALLDLRAKVAPVGAIALPVACLVLFWGALHARGPIASSPLLASRIVSLHVLAILASFGLFAVAFGCAALYLVQNRLLKARSVAGVFRRLPPLETLDRVAYQTVAYALPLLTLGLALGVAYAYSGRLATPPSAWLLDIHTLVSLMAWALYGLYLAARLLAGWRGVRLQYILLMGLLVALALYAVPSSTHHFS